MIEHVFFCAVVPPSVSVVGPEGPAYFGIPVTVTCTTLVSTERAQTALAFEIAWIISYVDPATGESGSQTFPGSTTMTSQTAATSNLTYTAIDVGQLVTFVCSSTYQLLLGEINQRSESALNNMTFPVESIRLM